MRSEETAASYDRIAHFGAGEAFEMQNGLAQHERAIRFTTLRGRALDVGSGSSGRIIQLLIDHGFQAEGLLRERGCPKINLQVRAMNRPIIEFYQRLGFVIDDVVSLGKRLVTDEPFQPWP